jgi:hypothetical protein
LVGDLERHQPPKDNSHPEGAGISDFGSGFVAWGVGGGHAAKLVALVKLSIAFW